MTRAALSLLLALTACVDMVDGDHPEQQQNGGNAGPIPPGKIAIVLAHGLGGSADDFDPTIGGAIESLGHATKRTEVPAVESVAVRAAALGPQIDAFLAQTGTAKVHIIAHSMGGLDARYLITKLGYAGKVASLTTISTPHRGSPLADVALGITQSSALTQSEALDAILKLVGPGTDSAALNRALVDLSVQQAATFNATVTDAAGVTYFSYAGFSTPNQISNDNATAACGALGPGATPPLLLLAQPVVANGIDRIPNDAVVAIPSATWGAFGGCIAADHLSEIGAATTTHDSPAFFRAIAEKLALL